MAPPRHNVAHRHVPHSLTRTSELVAPRGRDDKVLHVEATREGAHAEGKGSIGQRHEEGTVEQVILVLRVRRGPRRGARAALQHGHLSCSLLLLLLLLLVVGCVNV